MSPWEFVIESPEDLGPFRDLLLDHGHPGSGGVTWLITEGKFPLQVSHQQGVDVFVSWRWDADWSHEEGITEHWVFKPKQYVFRFQQSRSFWSCTEAVWGVINARLYREYP